MRFRCVWQPNQTTIQRTVAVAMRDVRCCWRGRKTDVNNRTRNDSRWHSGFDMTFSRWRWLSSPRWRRRRRPRLKVRPHRDDDGNDNVVDCDRGGGSVGGRGHVVVCGRSSGSVAVRGRRVRLVSSDNCNNNNHNNTNNTEEAAAGAAAVPTAVRPRLRRDRRYVALARWPRRGDHHCPWAPTGHPERTRTVHRPSTLTDVRRTPAAGGRARWTGLSARRCATRWCGGTRRCWEPWPACLSSRSSWPSATRSSWPPYSTAPSSGHPPTLSSFRWPCPTSWSAWPCCRSVPLGRCSR